MPYQKPQAGPSTFDPSEFWKRKHWYISNAIKFRSGPILVTEGQYNNPLAQTSSNGKRPKNSVWILIFTKLDDTNQPLSASQRIDSDTRLPTGIAISGDKWRDLKRAFGRFFMHKESRCQQEVNQFLMLSPTDYQDDKIFEDCDGASVMRSPIRDPGLLERSKQRAVLIEKALAQLPAYGMEHDDEDLVVSVPTRKSVAGSKSGKGTQEKGKRGEQESEEDDDGEDDEEGAREGDGEVEEGECEEDEDSDEKPKTPDELADDTVTLFADSDFEDTEQQSQQTTKAKEEWQVKTKKKNEPKSDKGETTKGKGKKGVLPATSTTKKKIIKRKETAGANDTSEDVDLTVETIDDGEPKTKKKKMSYAKAVSGSMNPV